MEWRSENGLRWLEAELPGARAAFSTRLGGVSEEPFASLNLAILSGDDHVAVRENRRRLASALGIDPEAVVISRQVHGAEIARADGPQDPGPFAEPGVTGPPERDGHLVGPGLAALVFVADCLPVALAGSDGTAMLHCGWRGLAAGIIERGVRAVGAEAAAIGPGIGPCCYEVGEEVLARFLPLGARVSRGEMPPLAGASGTGSPRKGKLDLAAVARCLLERAGVDRVEVAEGCTSCEEELFFSHRRDGPRTGRQGGLAWPV